MTPTIYCIDGNIGAGKTSLLDELDERGYCVFREDVDSWSWCLDDYYLEPSRWAFTLQLAVLRSMATQRSKMLASGQPIVFIERSPLSGRVFAKTCFETDRMTDYEYGLYEEYFELIGWKPDVVLMLDTPVSECMDRIKRRDRECERSISRDYLEDLAREYSRMKNTIVLDHTGSVSDVADRVARHLSV